LTQGLGVNVGGLSKLFLQGELRQTDNPLDIAIPGQGFLEVAMPDGTTAFSRGGSLRVNSEGFLSTAEGNLLKPNIFIGTDVKSIKIDTNGKVMVTSANQTVPNEVGRIDIAVFSDSTGLRPLGRNLYASSERSGEAEIGRPGEDGFSALAPGFIEASNVKLVDEMVNLLVAQRAYSASVKVIQAADEMLSMSNNLRR
jgi:flagellar basal-body rod protein FlgG